MPDTAKAIKNALHSEWVSWGSTHPLWTATLHVDDDFEPTAGLPVLLVADDGGQRVVGDSWSVGVTPRRKLIRLTAFAVGRDEAITVVTTAADYVKTHRPGITRIEDVPDPLITRDRETGAYLASITMPVIVRTA